MATARKSQSRGRKQKLTAAKPSSKAAARAKAARKPAARSKARRAAPRRRAASERTLWLLAELARLYPDATCELDFASPYQLTVATILSAQSTDKGVNLVTPAVFARYPDPAALAQADPRELEALIHSTGFFRNKTRSLIGMARKVVADYGGDIPRTMEQMVTLPGVARKTANVVLGTAYGIPTGVVVDTHVTRLGARLGLTRQTDPVEIERDLMAVVPQQDWIATGHRIIWLGRRLCHARAPRCQACPLAPRCPSAEV